jgi:hypothetical protein
MSSLTILGDTSGSVVLQAPAVSGSTTLTLPTQTGTLGLQGPAFLAYRSGADVSIPTGVSTKVTYNTETFDTNSCYDSTTNYRFTPTVAGYYVFTASLGWNTIGAGNLDMYIAKNGSIDVPDIRYGNYTSTPVIMQGTYMWYMNGSTDYVEIYAYQGSGSTQALIASANRTWFMGYMVRGA